MPKYLRGHDIVVAATYREMGSFSKLAEDCQKLSPELHVTAETHLSIESDFLEEFP